jgi:hypothetical protein
MSPKSKSKSLSQFKLKFWQRESGALWLSFERERINEFAQVKPNQKVSVSGYVKWIRKSVFALVPTTFSNQSHLICINYTNDNPAENSYITVSGSSRYDKLRPRKMHPRSNYYEATLVLDVYDWVPTRPNFEIPKTNLNYKDFKTELTARVEGLEPNIRDFLAFTAISAPQFYENVGGLNLTMYDSTKLGLPRLVVKELKTVIPQDIGRLHRIDTEYGRFGMRYKYSFFSEDADTALSKKTETLLFHRQPKNMPEYTETSLALFSAKNKPMTIEDPAVCATDVPTVVPENTSVLKGKIGIDQIDAFQFLITSHMKTPVISKLDSSLSLISERLEKLCQDYDLEQRHLTQYGFLNANYNAKPTSILRNCLAHARAQNIDIINPDNISQIFNTYFKWNFEYVYEVWGDLLAPQLIHGERMASLRVKYRDIIRIIRKYQNTKQTGVNENDIIREAKTKPQQTQQLLRECLNDGIIYQPKPGYYKLTRE